MFRLSAAGTACELCGQEQGSVAAEVTGCWLGGGKVAFYHEQLACLRVEESGQM